MNKVYIRVTDSRLWIMDYNFVCASFFIPITVYACVKLKRKRKKKVIREEEFRREHQIRRLKKFYKILKVAGSIQASAVLFEIIRLRGGGDLIVVPGINDCISIDEPSYVDDERILRFLNDKFSNFAIKGVIYITKEALCYLVEKEGLIDFPIVFLERIKIDGIYSFIKNFSEWGVWSVAAMTAFAGLVAPHLAIVYAGYAWFYIHDIKILEPRVKEVNKLTGKFVPRIGTRKDAIVFDAKKEPLPPVIEKSTKPIRTTTVDTEYEITENKLVDVSKVSGLKNKFSDRIFRRKKAGKTVYFGDKVREWDKLIEQNPKDEAVSIIDEMLKEGII